MQRRSAPLNDPVPPELEDLADRWRAARAAAKDPAADPPERLRRAFDHSLRLGKGFARLHGQVDPDRLPDVLDRLGAPCLAGLWSEVETEAGFWLERTPCDRAASAEHCDHWREAIDGLVLGLTGGVRHTRHQSAGHGSDRCLDLFYGNPESPLRYGALPSAMADGLGSVRSLVQQFKGADVHFLGCSEGELLYQLRAPSRDLGSCGQGGARPLQNIVERCLRKHFPALKPRELSPRPVLDAGGASQPEGPPR